MTTSSAQRREPVERHRAIVHTKLGLHDRLELTRYAIQVGLIEA